VSKSAAPTTIESARSPLRPALRSIETSIFSTTTQLMIEHDAIGLAQGFPDFDPPEELLAAGEEALRAGFNQYAPAPGLPCLRSAVVEHAATHYGIEYDPDAEVTVTAGVTEALWAATSALLDAGDELVVIEPFYETYPICALPVGAKVRYVTCRFPDFELDLDQLEAAFNPRTRLVIVNTPTNPSGRVLRPDEIAAIGELAERYDAFVVSDEAYEHVTYDGRKHTPVASDPRLRDRTVTLGSISKTFSATGWRIGWALAAPALTDALRKVHQFLVFSASAPLQRAAAQMFGIAARTDYYERFLAEYDVRRRTILDVLEQTTLEVAPPEGAYFVNVRIEGDDVEWCRELIVRARVVAIPASVFFHDKEAGRGIVRFVFCKKLETLQEAGRRLLDDPFLTGG
jgi:N-succinyldiaminopimelate aminotransferase